jgi:hypothetical protein
MKALLRLYEGSMKALLRLYEGSMKALLRLYFYVCKLLLEIRADIEEWCSGARVDDGEASPWDLLRLY